MTYEIELTGTIDALIADADNMKATLEELSALTLEINKIPEQNKIHLAGILKSNESFIGECFEEAKENYCFLDAGIPKAVNAFEKNIKLELLHENILEINQRINEYRVTLWSGIYRKANYMNRLFIKTESLQNKVSEQNLYFNPALINSDKPLRQIDCAIKQTGAMREKY